MDYTVPPLSYTAPFFGHLINFYFTTFRFVLHSSTVGLHCSSLGLHCSTLGFYSSTFSLNYFTLGYKIPSLDYTTNFNNFFFVVPSFIFILIHIWVTFFQTLFYTVRALCYLSSLAMGINKILHPYYSN